MHVLVIEDDSLLGEGIRAGLELAGCTVDWIQDGLSAQQALATGSFEVAVLDLKLPSKSGMELLRELRAGGSRLPVLILTARDAVADRVAGLDAGADDYLVKPFDLNELAARLRALRRRNRGAPVDTVLRCGELAFDTVARTATLRGHAVPLSRRELLLLEALLENRGRILTLDNLQDKLYGFSDGVQSNAVTVHVHSLRRKLGRRLIRTVRGIGYTIPREEA